MEILVIGGLARQALARGDGEVCAVFRRSLYLRFDAEHFACIGDRSLGCGPLNALVADWRALSSLAPGERLGLSPRGAKLWRPAKRSHPPDASRLTARVESLVNAAAGRAPREGLGGAITGTPSPLLRHARPAMAALERWLSGPRQNPVPERALGLIGLGPGLTPSGDDYLAGTMIALRAMGRAACATTLWRWLAPRARGRTHDISRAHLAAAATGEAHEALHACLDALLAAKAPRWTARLAQLDRVGHCSGWDAMAGAVAVARAAT